MGLDAAPSAPSMLSHPLTVRGFLADAHTGAGLGDLKVELWAANGGGPSRMAVSRSDDTGLFRLRVGADKLASHPTHSLDVELRVLDGARLVLSELRELPLDDPPDLSLIVPPSTPEDDGEAAEADATGDYEVFGRIKGTVPAGATVQTVLKTLRDRAITERVVADAAVDASGSYRMRFERPADGTAAADTSLSIRLLSDGLLLAESAPVLAPGPSTRINLRPRQVAGVQSEYDLLQRRIADGLTSGVAALDGVEESAVEEVSSWIDVDADRLLMLQQARTLGDQTSLPPAIFYALGRSGTGASLDDLVDVPIDELRTTIQEAAAAGIIDSSLLADSDAVVERLAREVVDQAIRPGREAPLPGLAEILGAADIPREAIEHTLRRYQKRGDGAADFWSSFGEADGAAEAIGNDTSRDIRTAVQLSGLVGPDPAGRRGREAVPDCQ